MLTPLLSNTYGDEFTLSSMTMAVFETHLWVAVADASDDDVCTFER